MPDNKKYYYLKLKDSFYDTEDIKILESMEHGYEYSTLYLKLCLLSLKEEGRLMFKGRMPYNPKMLSTITGHREEVIEKAITIFSSLDMITISDTGEIYIDDMQSLVGHGSTEAERKAKYRREIKGKSETKMIEKNTVGQCPGHFPPEIEIEKEIKKEIDTNNSAEKKKKQKELKLSIFSVWEKYSVIYPDIIKITDKQSELKRIQAKYFRKEVDDIDNAVLNYCQVVNSNDCWYNAKYQSMAGFLAKMEEWKEPYPEKFKKEKKNSEGVSYFEELMKSAKGG